MGSKMFCKKESAFTNNIRNKKGDWGVTQVIEHLPSKHKALNSNHSIAKKKKNYFKKGWMCGLSSSSKCKVLTIEVKQIKKKIVLYE
jgi:hypothetical protein